jgi:hypothetical protein
MGSSMDASGRYHTPTELDPVHPIDAQRSPIVEASSPGKTVGCMASGLTWQYVVLLCFVYILLIPACRNTPKMANDYSHPAAHSPVGPSASDGEFVKYQSAVNQLLSATPQSSPFKVEVWTDKRVYEIGDTMTFFYRANRDVHVTLIDVGTSGRMQIVFPNKSSSDQLVAGGRVHMVPEENAGFTINVQGPPGVERIKVIATERPFSLWDGTMDRNADIFPQLDTRRAQDIELVTKRLAEELWAHAYTEIEIVPRRAREDGSERTREIKPKPPEKPVDIIGVPGAKLDEPADQETGMSVVPIPDATKEPEASPQEDGTR